MEHLVTVEPSNISFGVGPGETIFAAARRQGIVWPTRCQGRASCRLCYFEADQAAAAGLAAAGRLENEALKRLVLELPPGVRTRLACQATVLSDIKIFRPGVHLVDPTEMDGSSE